MGCSRINFCFTNTHIGPPRGRLVRKLGSFGKLDGQFYCPQGVAMWQDLVLITDQGNDRICVHRLSDGGFVRSFGCCIDSADTSLKEPFGIAVSDEDGLAFITESPNYYGVHCVSVWRIVDGSLISRWGSMGRGNGQFNYPKGIAVSRGADRLVYVVDMGNRRIQVFGVDGRFVRSLANGVGPQLSCPLGICLDGELLYVTEYYNKRISVLNLADGSFVRRIGLGKRLGDDQLAVHFPRGISVGGGWVAVSEDGHRVSVFGSADGSFLHCWGSEGSGDNEFRYPSLTCWSESHGVLVVADNMNHRVLVYQ